MCEEKNLDIIDLESGEWHNKGIVLRSQATKYV